MWRKLLFALCLSLALVACAPVGSGEMEANETAIPAEASRDDAGLPNPASVYCEEKGYRLEMREGEGGTYGVCLFPDGSECDEWAYFRGECQPGDSLVTRAAGDATADLAADGCRLYQNEALGYAFHYPEDATIEPDNDPMRAVTVVGPLVEDEHWPMIYVSHPRDDAAYRPPEGADLVQWLAEHNLLPPDAAVAADAPPAEVRLADARVAGATAVHTRFERSQQSYAYDKYFFAHGDQLFVVVIVHAGDKEDWALYNHFLENFQFAS